MLKKLILTIIKFFYKGKFKRIPFNVFAYLIVGGGNTALNILLFTLLFFSINGSGFALEIATVLAFVSTSITGFWLNKTFAFSDSSNLRKDMVSQFGKYVFVSLFGQVLDYFMTKFLIVFFAFDAIVAYVFATVIVVTSTYFIQRYFTFKKQEDKQVLYDLSKKSSSSYNNFDSQINGKHS